MDVLAAIAARHATRSFKPDPIPRDVLEKIVDAGRLAATGINEQPWEFVVITDAGMRTVVADLTTFGKFIAFAPACVAVFCRDTKYYLEDGSAASQNMLVAAAGLGVQSCWVVGDKAVNAQRISQVLGAPREYRLVSLLAMGYESEAKPRRPKRTLQEVLHWEKF